MILKCILVNKVPIFALHSLVDVADRASKILGSEFEPKTKIWFFPAYHPFGLTVIEELKMVFGRAMSMDASVDQRVTTLNKVISNIANGVLRDDFVFKTEPKEHQKQGVVLGSSFLRWGMFWGCGMGKTKAAVDIARYLKRNTLYLCPSRLVENTEDEFHKHSFSNELNVVAITEKIRAAKLERILSLVNDSATMSKGNNILIIGYETATKVNKDLNINYKDLLVKVPYELLFCDESHKLRTIDSSVSKVTMELCRRAYRRILMTGTPSLGDPLHLFVQMKILLPWLYKNFYSYKDTYVSYSKYNRHIKVGYKNLHIIRKQVDSFADQKSKEECLDLEPRKVIPTLIPMDTEQIRLYNEVSLGEHKCVEYNPIKLLIQGKLHQICGGTLKESPIDLTICDGCEQMMRCVEFKVTPFTKKCVRKDTERPVTNHFLEKNPKLDRLMALLDTIVNGEGKKVIVWYMYDNEHTLLIKALNKEKYDFVDYGEEGHDAVRRFNEDPNCCVFLSQIQSSSGITLNVAQYTIYYSLTFNLEHYLQSIDRNYRIGQELKVFVYVLLMQGTVDEKIFNALDKKEDVNYALLGQDLFGKDVITRINLR